MPTYVYRIVQPPGSREPEQTIEVFQSIHDAPLTRHPETGQPVERVPVAPMIGPGKVGDAQLRNAGFTKLTKTSDGTYRKSGK
jgi:hypothetical protein